MSNTAFTITIRGTAESIDAVRAAADKFTSELAGSPGVKLEPSRPGEGFEAKRPLVTAPESPRLTAEQIQAKRDNRRAERDAAIAIRRKQREDADAARTERKSTPQAVSAPPPIDKPDKATKPAK